MRLLRVAALLPVLTFSCLAGCGSPDSPTRSVSSSKSTAEPGSITEEAINSVAEKLEGDARTLYESALAAEPFPKQAELIVGKFHGEFKDGGFESYYEYERQPDGTLSHITIDMYGDDKEYLRSERAFSWATKGRVIYEQDLAQPEVVYFLLLEDVSEAGLQYKMIDPEMSYGELSESEDSRGPGNLPELPSGWTEAYE
jgi:hypothetical protein